MGGKAFEFVICFPPAYLHPSEGLYVQRVVFQKLSKGSASSGIVTS